MALAVSNEAERPRQPRKDVGAAVSYAISHRTRIEILIALAEDTYSPSEVAEIIKLPLNAVAHHIKEMAEDGTIELADTRLCRNAVQHFYRAVQFPEYSKEDLLAMHPMERQVTIGLTVQSLVAEIMAAMWNDKISDDPDHCLAWNRLNLDPVGRREITEEQERHWRRLQEIEAEVPVRVAMSKKKTKTTPYIVSVLGFERGRASRVAEGQHTLSDVQFPIDDE